MGKDFLAHIYPWSLFIRGRDVKVEDVPKLLFSAAVLRRRGRPVAADQEDPQHDRHRRPERAEQRSQAVGQVQGMREDPDS